MPIDPAEGLVQEMSDWRFKYTFYANTEPVCDVCGEKVHDVIEMKGAEGSDVIQACFNWRRDCFQTAWDKLYDLEPEASYLLARMIKYSRYCIWHMKNCSGIITLALVTAVSQRNQMLPPCPRLPHHRKQRNLITHSESMAILHSCGVRDHRRVE